MPQWFSDSLNSLNSLNSVKVLLHLEKTPIILLFRNLHNIFAFLIKQLDNFDEYRAHLYPATATHLRRHCDIAPEWVAKQFPSDSKISYSRKCSV